VITIPAEIAHSATHGAARLDEPGQVVQIKVVCAVVRERVDRHHGIEEFLGERQRSRVSTDRKNPILYAGIPHALDVLRRTEPQVGGPDQHARLAAEKSGRLNQWPAQL
jgi:hypothetical protein